MPNKPFTTRSAFNSAEVASLLKQVDQYVRKVEADLTKFKEAELNALRDQVISFGTSHFTKLHSNFIQAELVEKRGIGSAQQPQIMLALRNRYINQWTQAVRKGFATASDSAKGLQQKIQRDLIAQLRREDQQRRLLAVQKGQADPAPRPRSFFRLLLRIFGLQRATRTKQRRVTLRMVPYLKMLFRTLPRDLERDLMEYTIRFYAERKLFVVRGGKVHNSASTCRFCDGRVLTKQALDFVTKSSQLKVHLFHPNCRHTIREAPKNYDGPVVDIDNLPPISNGHFQGFDK